MRLCWFWSNMTDCTIGDEDIEMSLDHVRCSALPLALVEHDRSHDRDEKIESFRNHARYL